MCTGSVPSPGDEDEEPGDNGPPQGQDQPDQGSPGDFRSPLLAPLGLLYGVLCHGGELNHFFTPSSEDGGSPQTTEDRGRRPKSAQKIGGRRASLFDVFALQSGEHRTGPRYLEIFPFVLFFPSKGILSGALSPPIFSPMLSLRHNAAISCIQNDNHILGKHRPQKVFS